METVEETVRRRPAGIPEIRYWMISPSLLGKHQKGKQKVRREGTCRMCQRKGGNSLGDGRLDVLNGIRELTRHHLVPQRFFVYQSRIVKIRFKDVDANIIPLCVACHQQVESPVGVLRQLARQQLRGLMTQIEITFVIQALGKPWLDENYRALDDIAVCVQDTAVSR